MPMYGKKYFKLFFSRTKKALRLNLDIEHWGLKFYQVCSNDDPRLTFDLFMAGSNLCPCSCGNTVRMLRDNYRYAMAVLLCPPTYGEGDTLILVWIPLALVLTLAMV